MADELGSGVSDENPTDFIVVLKITVDHPQECDPRDWDYNQLLGDQDVFGVYASYQGGWKVER